ncbi:PAS domain-containing protein [bacterium]|nr:PAS domain-containing protein [bacterium]
MPDGTPVLVGVIRDITELRRMQEQLKESDEQRLKAIMDHCGMPVYIKDLDGRYLQLNRSFLELGDFDESALLGKTDYDIFAPRYADAFRENDLQVQRQRSAMEFEEVAPQADGDHTYVTVKFPLYDAVGQLYAICGISTDVTERKRMEAKLLRYTHELERSNQELDDFAYIASHDLKEPLRGLFNHASFLMEDYTDKLDEDGVHRLQRLSQLCQRMENLVNDLLYFSRLGRTQLAIQEVNLNAVVDEITQMMESTLKERKAKIVVPRELPRMTCDRPRMTEVFRNLITNAVKYNDKKAPKVEIGFLDEPDMAGGRAATVFYVKDNGLGIDPGFHQEIFRIFKRLQPAGSGEVSGTGVGLTFVKKIVERHGGRIWLESQPGKGSSFFFTILQGDAA